LQQEGIRICLSALTTWREDHGTPLENYLAVAVKRELGNYLSKTIAVVSVHGDWEKARDLQVRVDPSTVYMASDAPTPDEVMEVRQQADQLSAWRGKFRAVLADIFSGLSEQEWEVALRLYGLDGYEEHKPREVAAVLGVPVNKIYRMRERMKNAISYSPELWALTHQLKEIAPDGIEEVDQQSARTDR
jgi:hypothetical protein